MKASTVMGAAVALLVAAGLYALYGMDDNTAQQNDGGLDKNVSGLFGKITAQSAGSGQTGSAPLGRMTGFEGERDLLQFFNQAKQSQQPAVVYQAYRAFMACQSVMVNAANMRAGSTTGEGGVTTAFSPERRAAVDEILNRCKGFERMSEREITETVNSLRTRAKSLGSIEARLDESGGDALVDRDSMIGLLQNNTSSAFERALPALSVALKSAQNLAPDTSEAQHVDFALMLAACDLGRDCSAANWQSLMQCAFDNYCMPPLAQTWHTNLSENDKKHVLELKTLVLGMVQNNNYGALK